MYIMKKLGFLLGMMLTTTMLMGQDSLECQRMKLFVTQELKDKDYAEATMYYLKGEEICNNYDQKKYNNMLQTIQNTISTENDKARKKAYIDTLIWAYDRAEKKGFFNEAQCAKRATYIMQTTAPDKEAADQLYLRAFEKNNSFTDAELTYYYYNLYTLYSVSTDDKKGTYKKRLISDYFRLSRKIEKENLTARTQETLTTYFNNLVRTCDDILPELNGFMSTLPQDKEKKKKTVTNFLNLLKEKGCTESDEYEMLIDTIISIDNTIDAVLAKAQLLQVKKRYKESISVYRDAMAMTEADSVKNEILYIIGNIQYSNLSSYKAAYNTALTIGGAKRSKGLLIAANCVARLAMTCGASTFDRKCNYYYAAQLAEKAGSPGVAEKFRANAPSADEIFNNNSPASVVLSCWGVSVNVK